ncbi:MAG TPA: tetratricopeptide repeat protein [Pyrinomonadaceae bacterium]|nr:tetratricopeptide repeat protein [Pyrinomonadaceae bacterium]
MSIRILFFIAISLTATATNAQPAAFKRGDAFVARENYRAAIAEYNTVSAQEGQWYARAVYNIGVCHYELWQTEEAIVFYQRAIELKQGNYPRASHALGIALDDLKRSTEARAAYEQALTASKRQFAPATYRLGLLAARAGDLEKAAALFKEAASIAGEHVPASHNNHGVMLARLGFLKEAEKEFDNALKTSNGRLADAAHNLSLCRSLSADAHKKAQTIQSDRLCLSCLIVAN